MAIAVLRDRQPLVRYVRIYEDAGVDCHYLEADEVLHRNFFARDSSAMTPWGAIIGDVHFKNADYIWPDRPVLELRFRPR